MKIHRKKKKRKSFQSLLVPPVLTSAQIHGRPYRYRQTAAILPNVEFLGFRKQIGERDPDIQAH